MGNSSCSSWASRSRNSSSTSWTTSAMRASGRSILLTTRTTGSLASSALRSTKRVWGSGPSEASTSSSTPSTIVSPRSTSPPKSAWPGVSMMLSLVSPYWTAVFLARIVIPRSRSWSIESMTRSVSAAPSRNAPDWRSMASTSVVLPWSTWAMMETLRRSSREGEAVPVTASTLVGRLHPLRRAVMEERTERDGQRGDDGHGVQLEPDVEDLAARRQGFGDLQRHGQHLRGGPEERDVVAVDRAVTVLEHERELGVDHVDHDAHAPDAE